MIRKLLPTEAVAHLFAGWDETLIWSCLQGEMGDLYGLSQEAPAAALAALGDFVFLAGQPQEALAAFLPPSCGETPLLIPQNLSLIHI